MLDIQSGKDVDLGLYDFQHVFIALAVLAPGNIRVREFVHQNYLRISRDDRIGIHLFKKRAFVIHFAPRNGFELRHQFRDAFPSVCLYHADGKILATALPSNRLAQHAVGFSYAWRVAEE
jgi:hypothetical protein